MRLTRNRPVCFLLVIIGLNVPLAAAAPHITPPKAFFGFNIGDDYSLANYKQLSDYWAKLAKESDRLKVVPIGLTEEGRPQLMAIVTAPQNLQSLPRYQDIARRLALAEQLSADEAHDMAKSGKAVVWIDGGLHASEVLGAQQLIETLYQLVSADDEETHRILDNVIILFVHANPDGMDLCSDWYMRDPDPKKRSLANLPRLWQKYIGHDDNRDFYANNMSETRNMNNIMYRQWFPQIVYNHPQVGPGGSVLFCPPFRDPFNYNINPLVISGIDAVGAAMMQRFLEEDKPGATVRSGMSYSTWFNGGLRTTCYFHNMIGLLTETIGSPTPMQIPFIPNMQLPKADYLSPIAPQTWHFRQSLDYSVSANKAVLDYASRNREQLLYNIWLMGHKAIDAGNKDTWTITPKIVEAARAARNSGALMARGAGSSSDFDRLFHDPARRNPRGYVIPADQGDFLTATKFVNILIQTGVQVHRATAAFTIASTAYPAGSYIVKSAQPFRAHVLDMFEPQDHPNDFAYPGAPPTPPYDVAGYTLAFQMGVKADRILDAFDGPFEQLGDVTPPPPAKVATPDKAVGFFLDSRMNDSFRAVNRLLTAGEEVKRLRQPFMSDSHLQPAGTFFVTNKSSTLPLLQTTANDLGTPFMGAQTAPDTTAGPLKPMRIGLWDRYGGSMPAGWTHWLLERFEFPHKIVFVPELDKGDLRDKFDVLIFVDGAIGGGVGNGGGGRGGRGGGGGRAGGGRGAGAEGTRGNENSAGSDSNPDRQLPTAADLPAADRNIPEEFRNRRGSITPARTIPQIRKFIEQGGTVLTIGSSTSLAYQLGLPLTNHLIDKGTDGKTHTLSRDKFYVPGSILTVKLDPAEPLTWGEGGNVDVMFAANSPVFDLPTNDDAKTIRRVAWYDRKQPLHSGWAWGQEHLEGGVAIAEARVGKGSLILYGPEILFRGQPHGTFKLLFNGIFTAAQPAIGQ